MLATCKRLCLGVSFSFQTLPIACKRCLYFFAYLDLGPEKPLSYQDCDLMDNGFCYYTSRKQNWFDASDVCRSSGGELARFDSGLEERYITNHFAEFLPFWIGYYGHKHNGTKFVWSDGSQDIYSKLDEKSLNPGLSAGLCTTVANYTLWERRNCSEKLNALCRRLGKLMSK